MQGYNQQSFLSLGLYYNDELVSLINFSKKRISLGNSSLNEIELLRYANKLEYNIVGGFSKLLSYFKKNYIFNELITYGDLSFVRLLLRDSSSKNAYFNIENGTVGTTSSGISASIDNLAEDKTISIVPNPQHLGPGVFTYCISWVYETRFGISQLRISSKIDDVSGDDFATGA